MAIQPLISTETGDTSLLKINANFTELSTTKQDTLVSGTNIKTINSIPILGSGNIVISGGDALVANPLSQFASTTSLQLKNTISDETGSGALVFATSPTLVTPVLGVATATSINGATITSGTLNGSVTGTNTGDVTLAGTPNYITIAGQVITRALIDLTTHITGLLPFANIANVAT